MAYTHTFTQVAVTPTGQWVDTGISTTGDAVIEEVAVINASGGGANAVVMAFPATGFQTMLLLATIATTVTFTGVTVIDGVSTSDIVLVAGVLRRVAAITGACTAVSVAASAGAAGTVQISVLYNA